MSVIPEKLINFKVYLDDMDLLGAADLELPSLEYMTETHSGSGIAGEVDTPVLGHIGSIQLNITFRTWTKRLTSLSAPKTHLITARGSLQRYDAGSGALVPKPLKVVMQGLVKKAGLGKFEPGKQQDNEYEVEVVYLKVQLDGDDQIEIDKYNHIFRIEGEDYLKDVREHLGVST
jgi:P2 family phage contractile tail tube protein